MDITFASLLDAAGAGVAAGIITALISVIKTSIPATANWHGATLAFILSAVLYVFVGLSVGVSTLDAGLGVFIAWLTCAASAVGLHEVVVVPAVDRFKSS
jgi:hypothetical protein